MALGLVLHEVGEVGGVVVVGDGFCGRLGAALFVGLAGELAGLAVDSLGDAWRPGLAGLADEVAVLRQDLAVTGELVGEDGDVVAGGLELPGVAAGDDAGAGGGALGVGRVGAHEEQALAGDPVKARRLDPFRAVGSGVGEGLVVRDAEEDVGAACRVGALSGGGSGALGGGGQQGAEEENRKEVSFHGVFD